VPSILVTTKIPSSVAAILKSVGDVEMPSTTLDRGAVLERIAGRDALMCFAIRVDEALLDAAGPSLKVIANIGVGYDHIDVAAARARGVTVTNTPDVLTASVAELTWAMILGIARRVGEGERLIRRGGWLGGSFDFMLGAQLQGKQLGIVGAGRIGRDVAARAGAFGMSTVCYSRSAKPGAAGYVSLDELLQTSDVVSVHVPLRPDTRHLIDRKAFARMKRSAFLINTSRGPVVDEEGLAWALREHLIAGAALDVFEQEPRVFPDLLALENVLLVPHLGSATREARTAMAELAARNVAAVLSGQPAITEVTK
jgi:glyoxylate reductase